MGIRCFLLGLLFCFTVPLWGDEFLLRLPPKTTLYAKPSKKAAILGTLQENRFYSISQRWGNWFFIYDKEIMAWVYQKNGYAPPFSKAHVEKQSKLMGGEEKYVGVFIGLKDYENSSLPPLENSKVSLSVLTSQCGLLWKQKNKAKIFEVFGEKAQRKSLLQLLRTLVENTQPYMNVIIYYSGYILAAHDDFYISCYNSDPSDKREIGIPLSSLFFEFKNIPTKKKTLFLDVSYSFDFLEKRELYEKKWEDSLLSMKQEQVLISEDFRYALPNYSKHGVIADLMAKGFIGLADFDENGIITYPEFAAYCRGEMALGSVFTYPSFYHFPSYDEAFGNQIRECALLLREYEQIQEEEMKLPFKDKFNQVVATQDSVNFSYIEFTPEGERENEVIRLKSMQHNLEERASEVKKNLEYWEDIRLQPKKSIENSPTQKNPPKVVFTLKNFKKLVQKKQKETKGKKEQKNLFSADKKVTFFEVINSLRKKISEPASLPKGKIFFGEEKEPYVFSDSSDIAYPTQRVDREKGKENFVPSKTRSIISFWTEFFMGKAFFFILITVVVLITLGFVIFFSIFSGVGPLHKKFSPQIFVFSHRRFPQVIQKMKQNLSHLKMPSFVDLTDIKLDNAKAKASIWEEVLLPHASLVRSDFTRSQFLKCNLQKSNLANASFVESIWKRVKAQGTELQGSNFENATLEDVYFTEKKCTLASFRGATLKNVTFEKIQLEKIDFSNAFLENVKFKNVKMKEIHFNHSELEKVEFSSCSLEKVSFVLASLRQVEFQSSLLMNCHFSEKILRDTCFHHSKVRRCKFENTVFERCDWSDSTWESNRFIYATFSLCDFYRSELSLCRFSNCKVGKSNGIEEIKKAYRCQFYEDNLSPFEETILEKEREQFLRQGIYIIRKIHLKEGRILEIPYVDLAGVNINGVKLAKANLKGADLSASSLCYADLEEADLTKSILIHTDFSDAKINQVDLTQAYFLNSNLLDHPELHKVKSLQGATVIMISAFSPEILDFLHTHKATVIDFARLYDGKEKNLQQVRLIKLDFEDAHLEKVDFSSSEIDDVGFFQCRLQGSFFNQTQISNVNFEQAQLKLANFSNATLKNVEFDPDFNFATLGNLSESTWDESSRIRLTKKQWEMIVKKGGKCFSEGDSL